MEFHLAGLYLTKPDKKPKGGKFCWILHTPDPRNHRRWANATGVHEAHTHTLLWALLNVFVVCLGLLAYMVSGDGHDSHVSMLWAAVCSHADAFLSVVKISV